MNFLDQYLRRSREIIGDRTDAEESYDNEVVKWLRKGKSIRAAIEKANKRYPAEALKVDETMVGDVAAHYDYLMQHMDIVEKVSQIGRKRR
ncbi:MAG: hypothetical protein JXB30_01300 [Anaerolineae bacterium]|nr:hypothetical protein [Anaerolineae bacterium]